MKRLIPCILICVLTCACAAPTVTTIPESTVTETVIPKEDKIIKDSLLPIHVSQDDTLYRVYFSSSNPVQRLLTEDFTHHYGGKEYTVFKYYREHDILFFGADYSVKEGRVYCTLYQYANSQLTLRVENVLAGSLAFSENTAELAYIANAEGKDTLFKCSLNSIRSIGEADQCLFFNDDILYTKGGRLYYLSKDNTADLGKCGEIVEIFGDAVITKENTEHLQTDIKVFFPKNNTSYALKNIYFSNKYCINGYVTSNNKLYFLDKNGAQLIDDVICLEPVQGESGVVYSNHNGIFYSVGGKTTPLNIQGHPLSAYRTKGRLLIKTEDWLYDGSSQIGNPYRVRYLEGELYLMYKNNTVTGSIRKLDSAQTVVDNALLDMPFYSIGGKLCYFVKQSFMQDKYALKIDNYTFNDVDCTKAVYGSPTLDQIICFNTSNEAVLYINGQKELVFSNGKIYL